MAERWRLPLRDLVYLAENGLLRLSVRLFGVWLEFGAYEEYADDQWSSVALDRQRFTGFQDLRERDAYLLFRQGQVDVNWFHAPENEYCRLIEPTDASANTLLQQALERAAADAWDGSVMSFPIPAVADRPALIAHLTPVRRAAHDLFVGAVGVLVATPLSAPQAPSEEGFLRRLKKVNWPTADS